MRHAGGTVLKGKTDYVIVTYADMPLLRGETFRRLLETQRLNPGPFSLLTVIADDPRGFGRIVRKADGTVEAIVEEYVATPEQHEIKELNVGAYCFRAEWLWDALHRIEKNPKKGEYYLTDIVEIAVKENLPVQAVVHDDFIETIGINTRVHLSEAEAALRMRINQGAYVERRQHDGPCLHLYRSGREDWQRYDNSAKHIHSWKYSDW